MNYFIKMHCDDAIRSDHIAQMTHTKDNAKEQHY